VGGDVMGQTYDYPGQPGNGMAAWKERQGLALSADERQGLDAYRMEFKKKQRETDPITVKTEMQILRDEIRQLRREISDDQTARAMTEWQKTRSYV
jgi:hypothetical protein